MKPQRRNFSRLLSCNLRFSSRKSGVGAPNGITFHACYRAIFAFLRRKVGFRRRNAYFGRPAPWDADAPLVPELLDTEGFERLCRWRYGLDLVYEDVKVQEDWKGDSTAVKTKWELLKEYHPSEGELGKRVDEADDAVAAKMKRQALFKKYLMKSS